MDLIADGLLIATALTAALYCLVLSRRLRRLTDAQSGVGAQIGELSRVLEETRAAVAETRHNLSESRASARNAGDALAREVAGARAVVAELRSEAALARRRTAARRKVGGTESAPTPEELTGAVSGPDPEDSIPDWPDGVIGPEHDAVEEDAPLDRAGRTGGVPGDPEGDAEHEPPAAGAGTAPLRVERMSL